MTVLLDQDVRLSQASIWQRQRDFYARSGVSAWYNQVPFYATSNAFIADAYASMIKAFMQDWHQLHGSQKFRIVELGAGCGQFSYLCLQALSHYLQACEFSWQYIMSDFDESLLAFCQQHPAFQKYRDNGQLIFEKGEIGADDEHFATIAKESDAPLIVIANYLFDSLPADIYRISNEQIYSVTVTVSTAADNLVDDAIVDFEKVVLDSQVIAEPLQECNEILEQYRLELLDSYILYPEQGLQLLSTLNELSPHGVLLLATDKAYTSTKELDYLNPPELTGHNGCFSMMVNFDALRRYAQLHHGSAMLPSTRAGIQTAVFGMGFSLHDLERLNRIGTRCIQGFAPSDYLNCYRHMKKTIDHYNLEQALSMLALSCWDPAVFQALYHVIFQQLDGADMLTIQYLIEHLPIIAEHYYWLEQGEDLLFQIAVIFHTLKDYVHALEYYEQSLHYFNGVFGLHFNRGVCHFHLNQPGLARDCFEKALKLDPSDNKVKEWLQRLAD